MIPRFRFKLGFPDICKAAVACLSKKGSNKNFRDALVSLLGVKNGWLTFGGRSALWLALKALDKPGSEVVIPAYLCPVVSRTVVAAGHKVIIADSDPRTLSIDESSLKKVIHGRVSAVIAAHIAGLPADLSGARRICREHGAAWIEDCAQSFAAKIQNKYAGTDADMAIYSFGLGKELNTGGGLLIADDRWKGRIESLYAEFTPPGLWDVLARSLSCLFFSLAASSFAYGFTIRMIDRKVEESKTVGNDFMRMNDNFSSYLGLLQLKQLPIYLNKRRENVSSWRRELANIDGVKWPHLAADAEPTYLRMVFFLDDTLQKPFIRHFRNHGIECITKSEPLYGLCPENDTLTGKDFPNARLINSRLYALPADECISPKEFVRIIRAAGSFNKEAKE